MSEYWKSTPKYWCKHCSTYVRDTKLERSNHESTGKHQSALKRFLRDLHRGHDQEQREKDRAKREIDRLNGIVPGPSSSSTATSARATSSNAPATAGQRQRQWEQLADMGIDVPTELRGDMAMAGEWTVTNTRVINDAPTPSDLDATSKNVDAVATGVRKRPKSEDAVEEEDALKSLFKKPRKWGRDTRSTPDDDADLDALLSNALNTEPKKEEQDEVEPESKADVKQETAPVVKKEDSQDGEPMSKLTQAPIHPKDAAAVKKEDAADSETPAVVFKKRKPKNIRQK
ncbi:hypothetical protein F5Y15DRAFT_338399 [Xylariaceae sp. FL0016]|nr:hypothetical protein F5Y15DRAFT_338399 [Xylariaceae sp. FL0016]